MNKAHKIDSDIAARAEANIPLRREFHENPQTGFEETYIHEAVTKRLKEMGLKYDVIAGTGIVVEIEGRENTSGRVIGLRADMDALDIVEESGVPWASKTKGKMHGCGHDGHTATLLTALEHVNDNRDFNGKAVFVFQPAEEGVGGAERMIDEGFLDKYPLDAFYAIHNWPDMPFGKAAVHTGRVMSGNINYEISITSKGGHAGMPKPGDSATDPILHLGPKLDSLRASFKENHPDEEIILQIPSIHSGVHTAPNVNAPLAELAGTIRTHNKEIHDQIPGEFETMLREHGEDHGVNITVRFPNVCSPTTNDAEKAEVSARVISNIIGPHNVHLDMQPCGGAEDFGEFSHYMPTSYIWLGNGTPEDPGSPHNKALHNPGYGFNDALIALGAQYFADILKAEMPLANLDAKPKIGGPGQEVA